MEPLPIVAVAHVSALGDGDQALDEALDAGRSGLSHGSPFLGDLEHPTGDVAGELAGLPPDVAIHESRSQLLIARCLTQIEAPLRALRDRIGADRLGVVTATSAASSSDMERVHVPSGDFDFDFHNYQSFSVTAVVARKLIGARGPSFTTTTACASAASALASAARLIGAGLCDAVAVVCTDAMCLTTYHGFRSLGVMDREVCRPFDRRRAGMNLGEGAAAVVVVRPELAELGSGLYLAGFGASADAYHMTTPDPEGRGAQLAMRGALDRAGIAPADVGYINLHGTGTPYNDLSESRAVLQLFGEATPCSSTKAYTGHLLGAAAGIEAAISLSALRRQRLPRNLNFEQPDPEIPLNVIREDQSAPGIRYALSNSFAFGGVNVSLLFEARP
jgi:3-oxoacyl-[acyl-carrier-protein] synthase I